MKYQNSILPTTEEFTQSVNNPCSLFVEPKTQAGKISISFVDPSGQREKKDASEIDFMLLDMRYKISGETVKGGKVVSPMTADLKTPAPLYSYSTVNEGVLGRRNYSWNADKNEIREIPEIDKAHATLLLFVIVYKKEKGVVLDAKLGQIEITGTAFSGWIDGVKGQDLSDNFNVKMTAKGSERENRHPKAKPGSILFVPSFTFSECEEPEGEFFISPEGQAMRSQLSEYLEDRTFSDAVSERISLGTLAKSISPDERLPDMG